MLRAVMFDLDGTLLPMDQDHFIQVYFGALAQKMASYGLDSDLLIKAVAAGTEAMVKNNGGKTNEKCFWEVFDQKMDRKGRELEEEFNEFYLNDFNLAKSACGFNPLSHEVVRFFKEKGFRLICATNPLFPEVATLQRIEWAGLDERDFEWITTFEKCHYCKPNPNYYREVLQVCGLEPSEVIMVGNDVEEDLIAIQDLKIQANLITDCLINRQNRPLNAHFVGTLAEFLEQIRKEY